MLTYRAGIKTIKYLSIGYIVVLLVGSLFAYFSLSDFDLNISWQSVLLLAGPLIVFFIAWKNSFIHIDTTRRTLRFGWAILFNRNFNIDRIISIKMTGGTAGNPGASRIGIYYERDGFIKRGFAHANTLFFSSEDFGDFRSQIQTLNPNITWNGPWWL